MPALFQILLIHAMPIILGYSIIIASSRGVLPPKLLCLSLAYGIGTGLITLWMFTLGTLNIPFTIGMINYPLGLLAVLLCSLNLKYLKIPSTQNSAHQSSNSLTLFSLILGSFLLMHIVFVFWRAFNIPISTWDAFATHAFNAKVFYYEQSLKYLNNQPHSTYPLHVPLIQAWLNLNLGSWNDQFIKTIFPFYFTSLLVIQYYFLRNHTTKQFSLLGLVFLVSSPFLIFHATIAYRDFTLLFYNTAAILLLVMWNKEKSNVYLISASLFAGFSGFTKLEGAGYLLIHTILFLIILIRYNNFSFSEKLKNFIKFCVPSFSICLFFHIYKYLSTGAKLAKEAASTKGFNLYKIELNFSFDLLSRLGTVLQRFSDDLFFSNNWSILWLIFFVSLFKFKKIVHSLETKLLLLVLILFFGVYVTGYTLTQHYHWIAETHTVLSRCILHFFPLIPALIILINFSNNSADTND